MPTKATTASTARADTAIIVAVLILATLLIAVGLAGAAFAAGPHADGSGAAHGHGNGTEQGLGQHTSADVFEPATAAEATRTVEVTMEDTAFEPRRIAVASGETVRFVVRNEGELVHEFNVGTAAMHAEHQKQMAMMVEHGMLEADKINHGMMSGAMGGGMMMHDDPNSVLLEPGQTGEVLLTFTKATTLEFACNVPGHYEAGMVGTLDITE